MDKNPQTTDENMEQLNDEKAGDEFLSLSQRIKKLRELEQWKSRQAYKEVEDTGQEFISLRWVIKSKIINNKSGTKTRFCACGF